MTNGMMFLEELISAGKTPQVVVMAGEEEENRDFMWDNLPGVRKPLTTEESEKLGTIKEEPKNESEENESEEDQTQGE